jgi:hypothetical protein
MTRSEGLSSTAADTDDDTVRVVQVSDTHVSRKRAYFVHNWHVFVDDMRAVG